MLLVIGNRDFERWSWCWLSGLVNESDLVVIGEFVGGRCCRAYDGIVGKVGDEVGL